MIRLGHCNGCCNDTPPVSQVVGFMKQWRWRCGTEYGKAKVLDHDGGVSGDPYCISGKNQCYGQFTASCAANGEAAVFEAHDIAQAKIDSSCTDPMDIDNWDFETNKWDRTPQQGYLDERECTGGSYADGFTRHILSLGGPADRLTVPIFARKTAPGPSGHVGRLRKYESRHDRRFGSIFSCFYHQIHVDMFLQSTIAGLMIPVSPGGSIASEYSVVSGEIRYRYAGPPFGDELTGRHVKKLVFDNGFPPPPYRGSCTGSVSCVEQVLSAESIEVCVESSVDRFDTAGQAILDSTNVAQALSVNLSNEVDQVAAMSSSIINHVAAPGDGFVVLGFRPNPIVASSDFSGLRAHPGCTFYWLREYEIPAPLLFISQLCSRIRMVVSRCLMGEGSRQFMLLRSHDDSESINGR